VGGAAAAARADARLPGDPGEPCAGAPAAPFCGESGGVASAAPRSAEVDEGESGDWPVGVAGSAGACSGRPALASSSRFRT